MTHRSGQSRLFLLLAVLLALATSARAEETVRMVVDFGDKKKTYEKIAWREEMTALDAMNQAKRGKNGMKFKYRGRGSRSFLISIDGVKNEGGHERTGLVSRILENLRHRHLRCIQRVITVVTNTMIGGI